MNLKLIIALLALWAVGVTGFIFTRPSASPDANLVVTLQAENESLKKQLAEMNENLKAIRESVAEKPKLQMRIYTGPTNDGKKY